MDSMSASDHLSSEQFSNQHAAGSSVYWRVHPNERPFSVKDATSREWASDDEADEGYSSFEKPEQLFGYFHPGERDDFNNHVVSFSGRKVGEGMDGEPLVVPDMKHLQRHSWDQATARVGHDKVTQINRSNGWE